MRGQRKTIICSGSVQSYYDQRKLKTNFLQEANFDHRIQPETESVIKMIMDTPFVVRIIIIGSCFSTILNLLILGVSQHARR